MKETEEIMGMIKEEGAAYFARERGNKVDSLRCRTLS